MVIKNKNYYKFFVSIFISLQKESRANKEAAGLDVNHRSRVLDILIQNANKYTNQDITLLFGNRRDLFGKRKQAFNILAYDPSNSDKVFPNSVIVGINLTKEEQKEISKCCEEYYEYEKIIEGYYLECFRSIVASLGEKDSFYLQLSTWRTDSLTNGEVFANILMQIITEQIFISMFVVSAYLGANINLTTSDYWQSVVCLWLFFYESTILNVILRSIDGSVNNQSNDKRILKKLYAIKNDFYNYDQLMIILNNISMVNTFKYKKDILVTTYKSLSLNEENHTYDILEIIHDDVTNAFNIFLNKVMRADSANPNVEQKWQKFINERNLVLVDYYVSYFRISCGMVDFNVNLKKNINNIRDVIMNNPKISLQEFIAVAEKYITLKLIIMWIVDLSDSTKKKIIKNIDQQLMQELLLRKAIVIDN